MSDLKVIKINTILFFVGWTVIMFLGADFPPPIGFLWLILLIAILDYIQFKYLQNFLPQLRERKKNLFIKNFFFFATGGTLVSLFCLLSQYNIFLEMDISNIIIWIIVLTVVAAIYGIYFWFFNLLLIKKFKM